MANDSENIPYFRRTMKNLYLFIKYKNKRKAFITIFV